MGVRIDLEGKLEEDFQSAGGSHLRDERYGVVTAQGGRGGAVLSYRQYLAGADFLVGLEGDLDLLQKLDHALERPRWQLFLGRKGYPPSRPVRLPDEPPLGPGLRPLGLRDALLQYPWPEGGEDRLRFVFDAEQGALGDARADVPLSFDIGKREFATRYTTTEFIARAEVSR